MIRVEIIVTGDVQEAGYRACILKIGRKLGLVGYTENLPDGTVKIVCEGEKEKIKNFVKAINIKTETIEVENIKVDYKDATGEFEGKGFIVKIEDLGQEMFQGYATAYKYFKIGWDKQDKMLDKQDKMLDKQDKMLEKQEGTLKAIRNMHQDMNRNFSIMAKRYDLISNTLSQAIKLMRDEFTKSRKETREEFIKSRKESANAYNKLAKAVDDIGKILKAQSKKK